MFFFWCLEDEDTVTDEEDGSNENCIKIIKSDYLKSNLQNDSVL